MFNIKHNQEKQRVRPVRKQEGFVLILALVMLAVMTLIGVSSMNSANIELKSTANAQQHQFAFHAASSLLEYAISKDAEDINGNLIDFQTTSDIPQQVAILVDTVVINGAVSYASCSAGIGSSLEDGKAFAYSFYAVSATGTNAKGSAFSQQVQGVRYTAASCERLI
ncbi:MAG: hypothetical protein COA54_11150 [Thiotrichaceae bacterium]|nr:MAG: hypothetical protein COA54_11150 [Thiotrichaceae bacterium]